MELKPYKTFLAPAEEEFIVNKSRFIGAGTPAETEEEALAFLAKRRAMHPGSNHCCYAYIIGPNMGIMRYSDDGEPGGTAGLPIIEAMKARGVTNCCVVVTRYFGGILLGAGGLVRAYSKGSACAINACGVGIMWPTTRMILEVSYPMLGKFEHFLADKPIRVEEKSFTDSITFTILARTKDVELFTRQTVEISNGAIEPIPMEEEFMAWPEEDDA